MNFSHSFQFNLALIKKVLYLEAIFLVILSLFRVIFYLLFSGEQVFLFSDILSAFWLGVRLDAIVIGYIQAPITLFLMILWIASSASLYTRSQKYLSIYLSLLFVIASGLIGIDFAYFSFFNEHTTLMVYGVLDDDTAALWRTVQANYNILAIVMLGGSYIFAIFYLSRKILSHSFSPHFIKKVNIFFQFGFFLLLIGMNILIIRGSLGIFPLSKIIPDVSKDAFMNEVPNNGVLAFIKASKLYKKSKSGEYDLIKSTHYKGKVHEAFAYLSEKNVPKNSSYIQAISYTTPENKQIKELRPHVVVVMVESFGLPITEYQSQRFNILGRLKKHFDEDILFTNFISASNGTIVSLEPLLLNITARPNSTSLAQSTYQYTSFEQASARIYQNKGYETHFVYGGDLKWRNVGKFMALQGFTKQEGKADIISSLALDPSQASHDWGVFDQHAYDYVYKLLKEAKEPQFVFLLTTNNHPPFTVPPSYKPKPLACNNKLQNCMIGDRELIQKRLLDYQYAVDMAGKFMDDIKSSVIGKKTVVAITADNNTIEGRIRYQDPVSTSKKIPFYLYAPKSIRHQDVNTSVAGSHKDLFPTLYNQTLSGVDYISVGKNLFDQRKRHCGFNDSGIIVSNKGAFSKHNPKNPIQEACDKEYDASLAVSDWLIQINSQKDKD